MKKLRNIQIVTNKYTECVAPPVDYRVWKNVRKTNPRLRVHLVTEGKHKNEITYQSPLKIYKSCTTGSFANGSIVIAWIRGVFGINKPEFHF